MGWSATATAEEPFVWTADGGMVSLGALPGGPGFGVARAASGDGAVAVGYSENSVNNNEAFRWTEAGGMVGLGFLPGDTASQAYGVSGDGAVVVGLSGPVGNEAFRWTEAGGMVGLGLLPGGTTSLANDVSGAGAFVVGWSSSLNGAFEAFSWTEAGGMVGLGDLAGGVFSSVANAVNADGSVVVGWGVSASGLEAFRWTEADGMVGLGDLAGGGFFSEAFDVSADGAVVVGQSATATGMQAFRWLEGTGQGSGMQSVASLLTDAGVDIGTWNLNGAYGVSDDGRVIVGLGLNPDGNNEGWRAVIGTGLIGVEDFFTSLAPMNNVALAAQGVAQAELGLVMNVARHSLYATPEAGDWILWGSIGAGWPDVENGDSDRLVGAFGISKQMSSALRLGIGAHLGDSDSLIDGVEGNESERTTYGIQAYMAYEPANSPLRIYAGVTATRLEDDLGRNYLNGAGAVSSEGERDGSTYGGSVVLGFEFPLGKSATVMPFGEYEITRISLDAYTETTGPFPAMFDKFTNTAQVGRLGVEMAAPMGSSMKLWGSLAQVHRFDDELPGVSGNIPVLASDFGFAGTAWDQDWTEAKVGLVGKISEGLSINASLEANFDGDMSGIFGFNFAL